MQELDDSDGEDGKSGVGMQISASTDSGIDKNGLGLDVGGHSRESSGPGRSANATPVGGARGNGRARNGAQKRSRAEEDDEELELRELEAEPKLHKKIAKKSTVSIPPVFDGEMELEGDGGDPEQDLSPYCICQRQSYGEMIGCDNDDCDIEWVSSTCILGLNVSLISTVPLGMRGAHEDTRG